MLLAAQAATMGSLFFGYFNDSLFWVVNRMMGISDVKQQMIVWSIPTTIAWAIGGTGVALLNLLFGSGGTWFDPCCHCWCWPSSSGTSRGSPWPGGRGRPEPGVITAPSRQRCVTRAGLLDWPSFSFIHLAKELDACVFLVGQVHRFCPAHHLVVGLLAALTSRITSVSPLVLVGLVLLFCGAGTLPFWRSGAPAPSPGW
jgi:hypothetical protein